MKQPRAKVKWLERHSVPAPYLALCASQKEFEVALKHLKVEEKTQWVPAGFGAATHTFANQNGDLTCIVCMPLSHDKPLDKVALLAHEAVHVKQSLMDSIGETNPSKEFEAYTVQNICLELFTEYARRLSTHTDA